MMIKSFLQEAEEKGFALGIAQGRLEAICDIKRVLINSGLNREQVQEIILNTMLRSLNKNAS